MTQLAFINGLLSLDDRARVRREGRDVNHRDRLGDDVSETQHAPTPAPGPPSPWKRRLAYGAVALGVVLVGAWIGAAFIPRWWSQRIGDQVNGSIPAGITLGLVYGFLFTVLPLLLIVWAVRKRRGWKTYLAFAVGAIALALPNLFTLGIVVGRGNAAHAGDRTLDVEAPGFRGGTLTGAILAGLLTVGIAYLLVSRRRTRDELDRVRAAPESPSPNLQEEQ
ncbi:MAG: hypothetical protein R6W48_02245 [Gaiellaceae bacterium]